MGGLLDVVLTGDVRRGSPGPGRRGRLRAPHVHLVLPPGRGERDPDAGGGLAFVAVAGPVRGRVPRGGGAPVILREVVYELDYWLPGDASRARSAARAFRKLC